MKMAATGRWPVPLKAHIAVVDASEIAAYRRPQTSLYSPDIPEARARQIRFQGLVIDYQKSKVSSRTDFRLGKILESGLEELFLRHPIMKELHDGNIKGCGAAVYDRCSGDRNIAYSAYGNRKRSGVLAVKFV